MGPFVFSIVLCVMLSPQTIAQTAARQEKPMKHYALIFQPTRTVTSEEQKQRAVPALRLSARGSARLAYVIVPLMEFPSANIVPSYASPGKSFTNRSFPS